MLFRFARGRESPPKTPYFYADDPIRPDEARLAAWALALGQPSPSADAPDRRRAHRGMLPDVDLSRAMPAPRGPGWATRLFRLFTRSRPDHPTVHDASLSGTNGRALGIRPRDFIVLRRRENGTGWLKKCHTARHHGAPPCKRGVAFGLFIEKDAVHVFLV